MLTYFSNFFSKFAKGWLVLLMIAIFILFTRTMFPGVEANSSEESNPARPVDILFFYTPDEVYDMVDEYGAETRASYRVFELTVDILYPIIYTFLLGITISWLFKRGFSTKNKIQYLNVLPLSAGVFDILENLSIVGMLTVHPGRPAALAWAATVFTMIKWSSAYVSIGLVLIGLIAFIARGLKKKT